jgi:hypothetical protein
MKLLWHYTHNLSMDGILKSGCVDVAPIGVTDSEKPVAWFSADQWWERTVRKTPNLWGMEAFLPEPAPVQASSCAEVALLASSAISCGVTFPSISARSISRPETPKTSAATLAA